MIRETDLRIEVQLYVEEQRRSGLSADVNTWPAAAWRQAERAIVRWKAEHPAGVLEFIASAIENGMCVLRFVGREALGETAS